MIWLTTIYARPNSKTKEQTAKTVSTSRQTYYKLGKWSCFNENVNQVKSRNVYNKINSNMHRIKSTWSWFVVKKARIPCNGAPTRKRKSSSASEDALDQIFVIVTCQWSIYCAKLDRSFLYEVFILFVPPISPPLLTKVWVWSLTRRFFSAPTYVQQHKKTNQRTCAVINILVNLHKAPRYNLTVLITVTNITSSSLPYQMEITYIPLCLKAITRPWSTRYLPLRSPV